MTADAHPDGVRPLEGLVCDFRCEVSPFENPTRYLRVRFYRHTEKELLAIGTCFQEYGMWVRCIYWTPSRA